MESLTRKKKYKELPPLETINRARRLLESCDIFTLEAQIRFEKPVLTTFRVWIGDEGLNDLHCGTNGKGMNVRYALASAYGEMMERLQNNILLPDNARSYLYCGSHSNLPVEWKNWLKANNSDIEYYYSPDERWLSKEAVAEESGEILRSVLKLSHEELLQFLDIAFEDRDILCMPYYDYLTSQTFYLPEVIVRLTFASNGMCAGNTEKEAVIQGLAEIYERYALKLVYDNPSLSIPVIDEHYYDGTLVAEKLKEMKASGMTYEILDMSMGKGLPVVGLRIWKDNGKKVAIHVGSDPSPITSLERCITELYQIDPEHLDERFHVFEEVAKIEGPKTSDDNWLFWRRERSKFYVNGFGIPPKAMLFDNGAPFTGFKHPESLDNDSDFDYMIEVGKSIGEHILLQNNSFLGFPAFKVMIPGVSELFLVDIHNNLDLAYQCNVQSRSTLIGHLPTAEKKDVDEFCNIWKKMVSYGRPDEIGLGFLVPPGAAYPEYFKGEREVTETLEKYVSSGKNPSEFFNRSDYPNCCHDSCDQCSSKGKCCLLAVGRLIKGIQEKQKAFSERQTESGKRGEIA